VDTQGHFDAPGIEQKGFLSRSTSQEAFDMTSLVDILFITEM